MNRLEDILNIVTTNSEESVEDFLALLSPDKVEKEELQQTFTDTIGYDPTTYFDKAEIGEKLDVIADDSATPEETSTYIKENRDECINDAHEVFEESKPEYFDDAINTVLEEKTGWSQEYPDEDESFEDEEY